MEIKLSGDRLTVRTGTPDLRVAFHSADGELEPLSRLFPQEFDGLIVDAGGYIGTTARSFSRMYPNATVISVEPSTENFQMLKENTRGFSNVHCVQGALSPRDNDRAILVDRRTGDWGFSVAIDHESRLDTEMVEEVNTISLKAIVERFPNKPIGILKLDIEGGEYTIFKNADELLKNIPIVFVELHDRIVPGCSDAFVSFSSDRWIVNVGGEKLLALRKTGPSHSPAT